MVRSKARSLFEEEEEEIEGEEEEKAKEKTCTSSSVSGEVLRVNQEYAKRFTHNKQREALHRLQELKKSGRVVDSSDDEDDEDDEDETPEPPQKKRK